MAISKEAAAKADKELADLAKRPNYGSLELSGQKVTSGSRGGRCYVCGCKVHRTETICGECLCEEDCD